MKPKPRGRSLCGVDDFPVEADVLIVGAGPAGSAAAICLRRAGRSVIVVDKATFPRDKCCGDGLTTLALRELEPLGLRPEHVPNWQTVTAAWVRSPSGREVCLEMPTGGIFAATTPRRELDAALLRLALEACECIRKLGRLGRGQEALALHFAESLDVATRIRAVRSKAPELRQVHGLREQGEGAIRFEERTLAADGNVVGLHVEQLQLETQC